MEIHRNLMILTGHSRGLGASLALNALEQGFEVIGIARGMLATEHPNLRQIQVDLADPDAVLSVLVGLEPDLHPNRLTRAWLVNNAGLLGPVHRVGGQEAQDISQAVAVNLLALMLITNWFVEHASNAADRRVVQVSSGAARSAYVGWSVYCATKAAVDHYARCLALEAQADGPAFGLRVCSLAPGVIDTDMQTQVRASALAEFPNRPRFEALKETGGLATPHAVAEQLLAYMGSEAFGTEPVADLRSLKR